MLSMNRSYLTAIIGFLIGCLVYLSIDQSSIYLFLFGGIGYLVGLYLDALDQKNQIAKYHFTSPNPAEKVFTVSTIPEALIIYSKYKNLTTILLEYEIKTKPQNFRLSVLKNFQEFEFEITEDSSRTTLVLPLYYPNLDYPSLLLKDTQLNELLFDIRERGSDFKNAIQKVVPGLFLSPLDRSNFYSMLTDEPDYTFSNFFTSPNVKNTDINIKQEKDSNVSPLLRKPLISEREESSSSDLVKHPDEPGIEENLSSRAETSEDEEYSEHIFINEDQILNDLLSSEKMKKRTYSLPSTPDLTPDEAIQIKGSNNKRFIEFLNIEGETDIDENPPSSSDEPFSFNKENYKEKYSVDDANSESTGDDSIKIDYSNVESSQSLDGWHEFNQSILSRIESKLKTHHPLSGKYKLSEISTQDE